MRLASSKIKYDKFQEITIDNQPITLIQHLTKMRTSQNISKKNISNIVKQSNTWYSQIEQGKTTSKIRQKCIYRSDLINIISVIKYNAKNMVDLEKNYQMSSEYIDNILHLLPVGETKKKLFFSQMHTTRDCKEQERLYYALRDSIITELDNIYSSSSRQERDSYIDLLKNFNQSMKLEPKFIIALAGQPFSEFLYNIDINNANNLLSEIKTLLDFSKDTETLCNDIDATIRKYIGNLPYERRNNFDWLDENEIEW